MKTAKIFLVTAVLAMAGCSTITFENAPSPSGKTTEFDRWHHIWAFDLYEGSKPVDLEGGCKEQGWQSVTTETSFLNGLAEVFTSPVWHPESVQVVCYR